MKVDVVFIAKIDSDPRYELLRQTLDSFFENTNMDLIGTVILIDDGSLCEWFPMYNEKVKYIKNERILGVGGSKNYGVASVEKRSDLLYFSDSDVYFTQGWVEKLISSYKRFGDIFKIIGGGIHPHLQPRQGEGMYKLTSHDAVSGWSWLLSYDVWDKYGFLADNAIGTGKSEDWEYCQRIRNDGFKVGCVQPQIIIHTGMTNTEGVDIGGRKESEALAKSIKPDVLLL